MSLLNVVHVIEAERQKLLEEAGKLEQVLRLIQGVSQPTEASPVPTPVMVAQTPEAQNGHQPMTTEAVIQRVLAQRGDMHFDNVIQAVIEEGSETRKAVIEAALYTMVKGRTVDFLKGNRYVLASA
jgi:hypothetical protein